MARAQLPVSLLEVTVGVVLVFGVVVGFGLGVPAPNTRQPQLDAYAADAVTILANEPPRHAGSARLHEVLRSPEAFDRERAALERRVDRTLPANLLFRLETPHGAVGTPVPNRVTVGRATLTTTAGAVTVRVWFA